MKVIELAKSSPEFRGMLVKAGIETAKDEIACDIRLGTLPKTVKRFSDLDEFVDANCYGGLEYLSHLLRPIDDPRHDTDEEVQFDLEIANEIQDGIDKWMAAGMPDPVEVLLA